MSSSPAARDIDTSRPHSARMYDYYLGGKDNFDVDREAAEKVVETWPSIITTARQIRAFMRRSTRVLVGEHGIRQWLDIGTGIPTEPNLHQVAQGIAPEVRVVYADHDPLILKYAQTLMRSTKEGRTAYIQADVTDPDAILKAPQLSQVLDLSEPVALALNGLLHFIPDSQKPYEIVNHLMDALPSGSSLSISHVTPDFDPESWEKIVRIYNDSGTAGRARHKDEVARFFDGLDLIAPGIEVAHRWHPEVEDAEEGEDGETPTDAEVSVWAGVGIKR
ncbi:SAM-dependent methyltransferase [Streptomyces sp. TS71-3]|uniref:SAM-dependent methyltransferase n=1 Tax=Streptomyces sp. TS71-3 TaxID=2733862 RepID=UPI001B257104|nr:SAM-dependent methyltransferase [Streptomyces sp. TS71-3]GHJ36998.1 hypothetical protein Sm713_26070 [Streptomyces sp. TS71-3]